MDDDCFRSPEDAVESYGKYISAIYRHLQILITTELAPFRIGSGQYIFLIAIAGKERTTQKALSEELLIDKTTTAKAIAKLEAEGYVRREPDPTDNRYHLLYLTETGRAVVPKVREALDDVRLKSSIGISGEEYTFMLGILKKVLRNVNEQVRNKGKQT
ncbi:MarR family transcriptional regulator [Paenibacillus psychroresistens]|uniref:MarR family transcriptional regulator n=1 Tax=Paenibacillus psychroresistens TaxID=1778678 RepID=A0A6B8RW44_9BACL|nr:MarR family winged helix-turn-helix transcriptional regulator [Paenibacillus psychroresistens]QGQ99348.1 MarR family transcriptional regulator [Paenibacillus psychroresistens]